jgi:large subunit ribosomal protein L21
MYAVIKTGGKQYRVQPGDLLVVEKLEGDAGAEIAFNEVLMLGDDGAAHLGAPLIDGAVVRATLIETRKGDKVHTVKKIRRQGHRRTMGHRQLESVLRVVGLEGAGLSAKWDGEIDMTPLATLRLRARGLAPRVEAVEDASPAPKAASKKAAKAPTKVEADEGVVDEQAAAAVATEAAIVNASEETPKVAKKASPAKKAVAAGAVDEQEAAVEAPKKKSAAKKKASDDASSETE